MLKKAVLGSCMLVLVAANASAQPYEWTGFYIGVNGGYGFGKADTTTIVEGDDYFADSSYDLIAATGIRQLEPKGMIAGGQLGFNGQSGAVVFGVEADFGILKLKEESAVTQEYDCLGCAGTEFTLDQTFETKWLMTARPRVGIAAGSALIFGTGGLAIAQLESRMNFSDTFADAASTVTIDKRVSGLTYGGGVEGQVSETVSFKVEYLYVSFGEESADSDEFTLFDPPEPFDEIFTHTAKLKAHIFRAGVNVRF